MMIETRSRTTTWLPVAALAGVAVLLLAPFPMLRGIGWRSVLMDLAHVPAFGLVTVALLAMGLDRLGTAAVAVAAAGCTELVQPFTGRSITWMDFSFGVCGVLLVLIWLDRGLRPRVWNRIAGPLLLSAAVLSWPVVLTLPTWIVVARAYAAFPVLVDFAVTDASSQWTVTQSILKSADCSGSPAAKATLYPGAEPFSAVTLNPVCDNWRGYDRLCWEIEAPARLLLHMKVEDHRRSSPYRERYNAEFDIPQGRKVMHVDLQDVRQAPASAPLNLGAIRRVEWFAQVEAPVTFYLHRVWLEKD